MNAEDLKDMQELWLRSYQEELAAVIELDRIRAEIRQRQLKFYRTERVTRESALITAWCAMRRELDKTVEHIVRRGGLLMIVNPPEKATKRRA